MDENEKLKAERIAILKRQALQIRSINEKDKERKLDIFEQRRREHLKSIVDENGVNLYDEAVKFWNSAAGKAMIKKSREKRLDE